MLRKRSRNRPDSTNQNHQAIIRRVVIAAILTQPITGDRIDSAGAARRM